MTNLRGNRTRTIAWENPTEAIQTGTSYTTLGLKVNFLRPITTKTGTVYAEGKVIHVGGRIATAEGRLTDSSGKLYAHGTTTCIILRPSSPNGTGQE